MLLSILFSIKKKIAILYVLSIFLPIKIFGSCCYSISTIVDKNTPVILHNKQYTTKALYGCYKNIKEAKQALQSNNFPFKKAKIEKSSLKKPMIILPLPSTVNFKDISKQYKQSIKNNKLKKVSHKAKMHITTIDKIDFLPKQDIYKIYKKYKQNNLTCKIMIIYNGVSNLKDLYKKTKNLYITKLKKGVYKINIPIIISSTATLNIKNATLYISSAHNTSFIACFGRLNIYKSKIYAWNTAKNIYDKRDTHSTIKDPRAFIVGLSNSKILIKNSIIKGLGYNDGKFTSGIGVLDYPRYEKPYKKMSAFDYFISRDKPTAILLGNDIIDEYIGFFSEDAKKIKLLGNLFENNIFHSLEFKNNSKNIFCYANIIKKTKLASAISISNGVDNYIISKNIFINNLFSTINLNKNANKGTIYDNLMVFGGQDCISIKNSQNITVEKNTISMCQNNSIFIKNSLHISINNNKISHSIKNSIEISSDKISSEPMFIATSAVIKDNIFEKNYGVNIVAKKSVALYIKGNKSDRADNFGGDLSDFYQKIIKNKGYFYLYGLGAKYNDMHPTKSPISLKDIKKIFTELSKRSSIPLSDYLSIVYLKNGLTKSAFDNFITSASLLRDGALTYLGYIMLAQEKKHNYKNRNKCIIAVSLIIEDIILHNNNYGNIEKLIYFLPDGADLIEKGYKKAISRMKKGFVLPKQMRKYKNNRYSVSIHKALNIFFYKMREIKTKNIIKYCRILNKDFTIFGYKLEKIKTTKIPFVKTNISQKNAYTAEQIKNIIKKNYINNLRHLTKTAQNILNSVNSYRVNKISVQDIWDIPKKANR